MFAIVMCLVLLICTLFHLKLMLCVLMVKGMSVVVNVMLYLMSVSCRGTFNLAIMQLQGRYDFCNGHISLAY